jgi:hypothetical protein
MMASFNASEALIVTRRLLNQHHASNSTPAIENRTAPSTSGRTDSSEMRMARYVEPQITYTRAKFTAIFEALGRAEVPVWSSLGMDTATIAEWMSGVAPWIQ